MWKNKVRDPDRKKTYLEITICVQQEVGRLEVPVDDISRMQSFQRSEGLVDKVLFGKGSISCFLREAPDDEKDGLERGRRISLGCG